MPHVIFMADDLAYSYRLVHYEKSLASVRMQTYVVPCCTSLMFMLVDEARAAQKSMPRLLVVRLAQRNTVMLLTYPTLKPTTYRLLGLLSRHLQLLRYANNTLWVLLKLLSHNVATDPY